MSLVVTTYVPEGIIMASDSRQTLTAEKKSTEGTLQDKINIINSDSIYKTFSLDKFGIGINTFGQDLIKGIPTGGYIKQFEETLVEADNVETTAEKLLKFFRSIDENANTGFHLAGYKREQKEELKKATNKQVSSPHVYFIHIKENKLERKNFKDADNRVLYGATWGGEADIIAGLLKIGDQNAPQIVWDAMSLQDAIEFSIFTISTTTNTMRFQARPKTVGGPIDVLLITPDQIKWIQRKEFHGMQT